jgi:hypothetical protein
MPVVKFDSNKTIILISLKLTLRTLTTPERNCFLTEVFNSLLRGLIKHDIIFSHNGNHGTLIHKILFQRCI